MAKYMKGWKVFKILQPKGFTAEVIAVDILKESDAMQIDKNKLIGQSYDGAAVMSGSINGVQKIVQNTYPYVFYVHC